MVLPHGTDLLDLRFEVAKPLATVTQFKLRLIWCRWCTNKSKKSSPEGRMPENKLRMCVCVSMLSCTVSVFLIFGCSFAEAWAHKTKICPGLTICKPCKSLPRGFDCHCLHGRTAFQRMCDLVCAIAARSAKFAQHSGGTCAPRFASTLDVTRLQGRSAHEFISNILEHPKARMSVTVAGTNGC